MDTKNATSDILLQCSYNFEVVIANDYGKVFLLAGENTLICELMKGYVPIEEFKEIFNATVPFIEKLGIKKFIFDKQKLRVFHQQSMEWYFLNWKKEIYSLGLSIHRKILPQNEPLFKLAVEAGLAKIKRENQDTIISLLDIQYCASVPEAIKI